MGGWSPSLFLPFLRGGNLFSPTSHTLTMLYLFFLKVHFLEFAQNEHVSAYVFWGGDLRGSACFSEVMAPFCV
jgi:Tfp pilus assembly protein PilZ